MHPGSSLIGTDLAAPAIHHNHCGLWCLAMQPLQFSLFELLDLFVASRDPLPPDLFGQALGFLRSDIHIQEALKLLAGLLERSAVAALFYRALKYFGTAPRCAQLQGLIQEKKFYGSASSDTWRGDKTPRPPAS